MQSFIIPQGKGIFYILFEEIPYWLTAISPITCHRLYFIQYMSYEELLSKTTTFLTHFLEFWPTDKVFFGRGVLPQPDLVLISGSQRLLSNLSFIKYDAPTIFTHEFTRDSKLCSPYFKFLHYKHSHYGGCTNFRLCFGFRNIPVPPDSLKIQ